MAKKIDAFEVVVGNIGTVYSGNNYMQATAKYSSYVKDSKAQYGRAAGESVVLFHHGHIRAEYEPVNVAELQVLDESNRGQF